MTYTSSKEYFKKLAMSDKFYVIDNEGLDRLIAVARELYREGDIDKNTRKSLAQAIASVIKMAKEMEVPLGGESHLGDV